MDRILEKETPADFENDYPVSICGRDKEGNLGEFLGHLRLKTLDRL